MYQFDDNRTDVTIIWQKPITIEEVRFLEKDKCKDTYFYKIVGLYNGNHKLFYIGKCYEQYITTRIFQPDHIRKQADFKLAHKKHRLLVSLGDLSGDNYTSTQISNIESLLIYSHSNEDFTHIKNKQCSLSHSVIKNYRITNKGWRADKMYSIVAYGLFAKW